MLPPREQMIEDLVKAVEDWDLNNLIEYVQDTIREKYDEQPFVNLAAEWKMYCDPDEQE